jgi:hypothetical protein
MLIFLYWAHRYYAVPVDFTNVSTAKAVIFIGLAFIVGIVFDSVCSQSWLRIFRPKDLYQRVLTDFINRNPRVPIHFKDLDWYIFFSFIRKQNMEMAREIEHYNVYGVMLRNISFGLLIITIQAVAEFIQRGYQWRCILLSAVCLLLSINVARQAVTFQAWFYVGVLQSFTALVAEPSQFLAKVAATDEQHSSDVTSLAENGRT